MNSAKVILAGAGPGDPELISVKALRYLKTADVVLTDRLVSPELIKQNVSALSKVIYVGKQCSKGIHTSQKHINQLMVYYAKKGKTVLRLKGGDVSVFSNVLDELRVLKKNNISYEVIPGISCSLGAAAYSAIPLTAREYSRGVRFLTLFKTSDITSELWKDWAQTSDTLVFYMSGQKLKYLVEKLLFYNVNKDKQIAVIEQASTEFQNTKVYSFNDIESIQTSEFKYVPTLIIIGKVVALHKEFAWKQEVVLPEVISYFDNHLKELQHAI
ncbi:uroporphyrinogen-III C-methyltransferase [Myroides marinus]|uniref:uroporphyrinogen-III C-methyltransferase n=1 Tax=Myroides marinus TaxID=703342 RepID=UPI002577C176|nr:uroporphyrinogen-III C-methyltransferase [Myroides marinus]MDM1405114.1 uroporphyrinogen-III C-methyltransferase [Myroides marinus]